MEQLETNLKAVWLLGVLLLATVAQGQDLHSLIDEALANNPEIKQFDLEYQIASEKINEANSLPNTDFSIGVMAVGPEMDMPMERFRVSVMQMLPWFGTLSARQNYEASVADAQFVDITIAKRKLALAVAQKYYELYGVNAKNKVIDDNILLLKSYEQLALNALESNRASMVDVLRLQMRQNELLQEKELLLQQKNSIQSAINGMLNRPHDQVITVVSTLEMPQGDLYYAFEDLKLNPELEKYDKLSGAVELLETWNQKEGLPMLGVGIEYINQESHAMITSSFKDMVMPMVTLSIPIFNKKYSSQTRQNLLRKQEIETQKTGHLNALTAQLANAVAERSKSRTQFNTQAKNRKQAQEAEAVLIKNYETGTIDFKDILDIQELQLKFQVGQVEAIIKYYVQSTIINYLTQ